jgi:signal peptidase I
LAEKKEHPLSKIRGFFLPRLTPGFLLRVAGVGLSAYLFFGHVCTPLVVKGRSMEPAHQDGSFTLCWRLNYLFSKPRRHDRVAVRLAGSSVVLLKRVVALEGERVEFRNGRLFVNENPVDEPYLRSPCHWNLPPRTVEQGSVYVVGDNRSMEMEDHAFGQASLKRIIGAPLW